MIDFFIIVVNSNFKFYIFGKCFFLIVCVKVGKIIFVVIFNYCIILIKVLGFDLSLYNIIILWYGIIVVYLWKYFKIWVIVILNLILS